MIHLWSRRSVLGSIGASTLMSGAAWSTVGDVGELVILKTDEGRTINVTRWRASKRRGTILFSHGALSAPSKYNALITPWLAAGFDVWAPLHVDSTDHPDTKQFTGLASWPARIADLRALARHVGASRYVAAGHSYGALVALTLGGVLPVRPAGVTGPLRDPHARAVIAFSPPGPGMGLIDAAGYATLAVPAFIETGTADIFPGTPPSPDAWRPHLSAFDSAEPGGDRYAIVLDGADHYFGGAIGRPDLPGLKQHAQLDVAVARSVDFLRGYALGDQRARKALLASASMAPATSPGLYHR